MVINKIPAILSLILFMTIEIVLPGMVYSDDTTTFNTLRISSEDIPAGFMFGKIPQFAKKVFPENPCIVSTEGIQFLAGKLYPEGNPYNIKNMYVAIMSESSRPFGDDIVCYVLMFKDQTSASSEIKKIQEFYQYNKDRIVLIIKGQIAIMLFADDINNYKYIAELGNKLSSKLD
jgi:hypothetical protein